MQLSLEFQESPKNSNPTSFFTFENAGWGEKSRFAADIFNDLHAEAMTIMGCYHDLKARVTKLELVLPAVEKSLLSEASHLRFIYSPGMYVCMMNNTNSVLFSSSATTSQFMAIKADRHLHCAGMCCVLRLY
jgi:hypothetical protein